MEFCTTRFCRVIKCNRGRCHRYKKANSGLRNVTSITCGCDWISRFRSICRNNNKISDHVVITYINSVHSNTCDPSYIGLFLLSRSQSSGYKRCGDEVFLKESMLQMAIDPFVNVRAMTEVLQKALPDRKDVDIHMINNVKIRAGTKKLELDSSNIQIDSNHFDQSFINHI